MKRLALICLFTILSLPSYTQIIVPRVPDVNTAALWHLDESTPGNAIDASANGLTGTSIGTTVVAGRAGNARSFNGLSDYIIIGNQGSGPLGFGPFESFMVECWFTTTSTKAMVLIRKGLAPEPGFTLMLSNGKVVGIIGNREDGTPPDALVSILSAATYNDGQWHHARLSRDRVMQQLRLAVDGQQAATPVTDTFPYAISSDRPLTIGRWEVENLPYFFEGAIDEVCVRRDTLQTQLFTPLMAAWNFDTDTVGVTIRDSSANKNDGAAYGTSITAGVTGSARSFNGSGDYLRMEDALNGSLDFDTSQSFTVEAWFKTTSAAAMQLLRKGLAPEPGYGLFVSGGYVAAVIGNREDGTAPDTLLILKSTKHFIDGTWHHVSLIRDRASRKVYLYVDHRLVTPPLDDSFPYPIASDRPLTIGRWEYPSLPYFFQGDVDRVAITRGAIHPASPPGPSVLVRLEPIDWGTLVIGDTVARRLTFYNSGSHDTLRVSTIGATLPVFSPNVPHLTIGPRDTASIVIRYAPATARRDSGWLSFATNDPETPSVNINLLGRGTPIGVVALVSPLNYTTMSRDTITFKWRKALPAPATYWFEWSTVSSFAQATVDSSLTDTLTLVSGVPKSSYIYWRVRAGNQFGWGEYSLTRTIFRTATSVPEAGSPSAYALLPNYPNPFNPSTTIVFTVPAATWVRVDVHNAVGELMRVVGDGIYPPGEHRLMFDGAGLPSGMYFARMRAGSALLVRPMLLMK